MNFIERIIEAAKKYPQVKRVYISCGEIITEPRDARDTPPKQPRREGDTGWPAAWAIAEEAGVAWGCGNHGQHQIQVTRDAIEEALPQEYKVQRAEYERLDDIRLLARSHLEMKLEEVRLKAEKEFLATEEGKSLTNRLRKAQDDLGAIGFPVAPVWLTSGEWFEVEREG